MVGGGSAGSFFLYGSMSFVLGNLPTVDDGRDGGVGESNVSCAPNDVEVSLEVEGDVGTKNLAAAAGLAAGTDGDWKEFAGESLPLLKVSTYLDRTPTLRAEN